MRRVLLFAYYFPPMGLSGVQRVAKLAKYLPDHGWKPTVITVAPGGYFAYDEGLLEELRTREIEIVRTFSLDPTRLFGTERVVALPNEERRRRLSSLSQWLFVPDNKIGWYPWAVAAGVRLGRGAAFDAVLSSAPPYSGHLAAARVSELLRIPLVVDFRDDWLENPRHVYPTAMHRWMHRRLERRVLGRARRVLTINEPIRRSLLQRARAGGLSPAIEVVPQGFDPEDFARAPHVERSAKLRLLYTGIFYDAQTPDYFLRGLAELLERRPELRERIEAVFVGLVPDASRELAGRLGLDRVVRFEGYMTHAESVGWLGSADVLWMTVGRREGAEQISTGKLFEYFGAAKPILALVPEGAARQALAGHGACSVVEPDDVAGIASALGAFADAWAADRLPRPARAYVDRYDRRRLAGQVAGILASVSAPSSSRPSS